jgi:hypothetical protein
MLPVIKIEIYSLYTVNEAFSCIGNILLAALRILCVCVCLSYYTVIHSMLSPGGLYGPENDKMLRF